MLTLRKTRVRAPKPKVEKPPKKPANVYIAGPLYSITKGLKQVTGALVEFSAESLIFETTLASGSIQEESKEEEHLQTPQRYDRGQHKYDTPPKVKVKYRELGRRANVLYKRLSNNAPPHIGIEGANNIEQLSNIVDRNHSSPQQRRAQSTSRLSKRQQKLEEHYQQWLITSAPVRTLARNAKLPQMALFSYIKYRQHGGEHSVIKPKLPYRKTCHIDPIDQRLISEYVIDNNGILTAKLILTRLADQFVGHVSIYQIRAHLKREMGFSYRRITHVSTTMNSDVNKRKRRTAAIDYINTLYQGKQIINIDESLLNVTDNRVYSWVKKNTYRNLETPCQRMGQVSLIMGLSSDNDVHYSVNWGANNSKTIIFFLKRLIQALENTIFLFDNASYHTSGYFLSAVAQLRIDLRFLGPYQFRMAPVELAFAFIKKFDINQKGFKVTTEQERKQVRDYLCQCSDDLSTLDWKWVRQAFRHCLTSALEFVTMKGL